MMDSVQATTSNLRRRKRKAEEQNNDRLSKRLSLLNLERNGEKLYVPVEHHSTASTAPTSFTKPERPAKTIDDDVMELDSTKHKVYIYDLDAELSDSESDDGKLVFLPDIRKHLLESRIPPSVLANSEGDLAGYNKQLVLYSVPSSLTIPEEQDSARKAIIETRARARARQEQKRNEVTQDAQTNGDTAARDWYNGVVNDAVSSSTAPVNFQAQPTTPTTLQVEEYDPDAMDVDLS